MTLHLEVLVIAEHLANILFCHYSKIVFENESMAIFAGNTQKYSCPPFYYIYQIAPRRRIFFRRPSPPEKLPPAKLQPP